MNQKDFARFERHVQKTDGCWLWTGPHDRHGYGRMVIGGREGRAFAAHRLSYEHHVRPIPALAEYHGFCVCHICDVPLCVRPEHLFIAPQRVNLLDAAQKGRLSGKSKLSNEAVASMRAEYAEGNVTMAALAKRHGITQPYLSRILNGKRRAHPLRLPVPPVPPGL